MFEAISLHSSHRHWFDFAAQSPGLPAKEESSRPLSPSGIPGDGSEEVQYQLWTKGHCPPQRWAPDLYTKAGVQGFAPGDDFIQSNDRGHNKEKLFIVIDKNLRFIQKWKVNILNSV